jgi:hypothetical protein
VKKGDVDKFLEKLPYPGYNGNRYILAYGPPNCPKTKGKISDLEIAGLRVQWVNVNDRSLQAQFMGRSIASSSLKGDWPRIEINGRMYPSTLTPQEVRQHYEQ